MKNQLENFYGVTELSAVQQMAINGGSEQSPSTKTSFWTDVSFFAGAVVQGIKVFATQGGRNAGLVVK